MRRPIRFLVFLLKYGALGVLLSIVFANQQVVAPSLDRIFETTSEIPYNHVGLLLGTSPFDRSGRENPFFQNRIEAAYQLYRAGRVKYILASGDNEYRSYNEPARMRSALMEAGLPEDALILDYAGYRTLDSVVRTGAVYGEKQFTVISQEFHIQRAIYIAEGFGLDVVGFAASDVGGYPGLASGIRESLARVLAVLDVHVLKTQPRSRVRSTVAE